LFFFVLLSFKFSQQVPNFTPEKNKEKRKKKKKAAPNPTLGDICEVIWAFY